MKTTGELYVRAELSKQRTQVPFPIAPSTHPRAFWLGAVTCLALAALVLRKIWRNRDRLCEWRLCKCLFGGLLLLRRLARVLGRAAKVDVAVVRVRATVRNRLVGKALPV